MSKLCLTGDKVNIEQQKRVGELSEKLIPKKVLKKVLKKEERGWSIQGDYETLVQQYISSGFDEAYAQERIDLGLSDFDF